MAIFSYSPLRYPGGKAKIYKFMKNLISINYQNPPVYAEPFSGGFGLGMKLLINGDVSHVYINDLDPAIYSFWYLLLNHTDELLNMIDNTIFTIDEWKRQKSIYLSTEHSLIEKGFSTLYLNRTNRSGIITAGPIGGYNQNGNYKMDCRFNKTNLKDVIKLIAEYRDKITLSSVDGADFITKIDQQEPNVFFYLDPPYVEKGKDLYKNSFDKKDHIELSNTVRNLRNKWLVTYDDNPLIEEIYSDFTIERFDIKYSMQRKKVTSELAIYSKNLIKVE